MKYDPSVAMRNYVSLDEIVDQSMRLDKAQKLPLKYMDDDSPSRFFGIKNVETGKEICVVGNDYGLVQHAEAANWFITGIQEAGIEGKGIIKNYNDVVRFDVIFDNLQFRDPSSDDSYYVGASLTNSYNKQVGFYTIPFVVRGACSNGMIFKGRLGDVNRLYVRHVGDVINRVRDGVKDLIQNMVSVEGSILSMMDAATQDVLTFEKKADQILTISKYVGGERRATKIVEEYDIPLSITRFDLYNTLTEYSTWTKDLSFNIQDNIATNAEEILRNGLKIEKVDPAKLAASLPLAI